MTFAEFKEQVNALYKAEFPNSACSVSKGALGRDTFFITFYLAGNQSEFPNRIAQNDLLNISFHILQNVGRYEDGIEIKDDVELPDTLILDAFDKSILTKPDNKYMAYGSISLPFRKTTGTPEKILETLKRYIAKIKSTLVDLYHNDQVPDDRKEFVASKLGLTESKKVEDVEYISKDELDKMPDDYKTTVGDTIKYSWEDKEMLRKKYKELGYEETDPMILTGDAKYGTVLKPVKVKKEGKVTTASGTYEYEELKAIEEKMKQAFKDYWHGKITHDELEATKKELGLSGGEIKSCQYDASREEDVMKESKSKKVEFKAVDVPIEQFDKEFETEYGFLYDNRDNVAGYTEALDEFDYLIKNNENFKAFVKEFVKYHGDYISSDREAVAFMFALEKYIVDENKEIKTEDIDDEPRYTVYDYGETDTFDPDDEDDSQFTIYDNKLDDFYYDENGDNPVFDTEDEAEQYIQDNKLNECKDTEIKKEAMNGLNSENSKAQYLYDEFVEFEDLDTKKWNETKSQEERDKMALPYVRAFYKEHKDEIDDNWEDFMELLEYWNFHTEYKLFNDVVNGTLTESIQSIGDLVGKIDKAMDDIKSKDGKVDFNVHELTSDIEEEIERTNDLDEKDILKTKLHDLNNLWSKYDKKEESYTEGKCLLYIEVWNLDKRDYSQKGYLKGDKLVSDKKDAQVFNSERDCATALSKFNDNVEEPDMITKHTFEHIDNMVEESKEIKCESIVDTTPEKFTTHCDECLEDFEYTFDPLNEVSNDIEIYQKGKDYAYYAECPNCGNLIEVGPEELDLVVTNVDDISKDGFYMEIMDKHTARKTWLAVSLKNGGWQYEFNQRKFNYDNDNDIITSMFIQELEDYDDDIWKLIDEVIADEHIEDLEESATQAGAVNGGRVSLFGEKAKQLREKKMNKVSAMDDLDIIIGLEEDELELQDMADWNRVKEVAKSLAGSQGFYGRLLADMEEMEPDIGDESFPIIL